MVGSEGRAEPRPSAYSSERAAQPSMPSFSSTPWQLEPNNNFFPPRFCLASQKFENILKVPLNSNGHSGLRHGDIQTRNWYGTSFPKLTPYNFTPGDSVSITVGF